jgi:hypothetical protein
MAYTTLAVSAEECEASALLQPELWGRPATPGYRVHRLIVVGPYPTAGFFRAIFATALRPGRLVLVVDDGWLAEEIAEVREACAEERIRLDLRYAAGPGLVHAKLYLVEWMRRGAELTFRSLGWGSPNASTGGFRDNAEVLSFAPLPTAGDGKEATADILAWFGGFKRPWGTAPARSLQLRGGVRMELPRITFKSDPRPDSFAAWLQAGRLCHKYDPDQTFGKVSLQLKKAFPSDLESLLTKSGMRDPRQTQQVRYGYLQGDLELVTDAEDAPAWRRAYFVETWYGHWTSAECYSRLNSQFVARNEAQRRAAVEVLRESSEGKVEEWVEEFLAKLRELYSGLVDLGHDPALYFEVRRTKLDDAAYAKSARDQIRLHRQRSRNKGFEDRFVAGYVFPPVPTTRGIAEATGFTFDDFMNDLCQSIVTSLSKKKVHGRLAQTIRGEMIRPGQALPSAESMRRRLTDEWAVLGPKVRAFFEEDAQEPVR